MSLPPKKLRSTDYCIAWLCPVAQVKRLPPVLMLDEDHTPPDYEYEREDYTYVFGEINGLNIVIGT
jgi:hypothetical protein